MAAADTNVLLRLLVEDDGEQAKAARAFVRTQGPLFVSHVVLAEVAWVLASAFHFKRADLVKVIEEMLETEGLTVERPGLVLAALGYFRASAADFPDCLILAIAEAAGSLPLATFDKPLAKLPGTRRIGKK